MIDPDEVVEARRALGRRLAKYRQAAGLNQHQLAPHTHYSRSTIANVEVGRQNVPRGFWERADGLLAAHGALLQGYDQLQALVARQRWATAQLGAGQAAAGGPGVWMPTARQRRLVTAVDVEAVRELTRAFCGLDNKLGGGHAYAAASRYFDSTVTTMLRDGTYMEGVGRELHAAAAQLAHLVAWSAYDIQEHEQAQRYFAKATDLATSVDDRAFCGEILAARSHHAIHLGHPIEALALARAAQENASKAAVPALLAESHELEANGHALLGDSKASLASLHKAEAAFWRSNSLNRPDWLHYFDDRYLAARFAHCFRDLKQWNHARDFGRQAVEMSENLVRTRIFNTAVLATAHVETDLDEACALGLRAAHLARTFQSARVLHYIRDISHRLHARHGDHPQVRQFTEQLSELGAY